MTGPVGAIRKKGIQTMMKNRGMNEGEARQRMAVAIAMEKAGKHKKA